MIIKIVDPNIKEGMKTHEGALLEKKPMIIDNTNITKQSLNCSPMSHGWFMINYESMLMTKAIFKQVKK